MPQEVKFTLVFDEDIDGAELMQKKKNGTGNMRGGMDNGQIIEEEIESDEEEDLED